MCFYTVFTAPSANIIYSTISSSASATGCPRFHASACVSACNMPLRYPRPFHLPPSDVLLCFTWTFVAKVIHSSSESLQLPLQLRDAIMLRQDVLPKPVLRCCFVVVTIKKLQKTIIACIRGWLAVIQVSSRPNKSPWTKLDQSVSWFDWLRHVMHK